MEENLLQRKIHKQIDLIRQKISGFRKAFETKDIKHNNFIPYLSTINDVFDLNNSYAEDYYQYIPKKHLETILANNRFLMKDISAKLKSLSIFVNEDKKEEVKQDKSGVCKICTMQIQERNIHDAKNHVQGIGMSQLKKLFRKFEEENNAVLFSPDEDRAFFKQLQRILNKKEEILSITDNHLENYLDDIMKNLQEVQYLEDMKETTFQMPPSINWDLKIKSQINSALLNNFKGKIPVWIQKTFDEFVKLYTRVTRKLKQSKSCQTEPYTQDQVIKLRKVVQQFKQQQNISKDVTYEHQKKIIQLTQKCQNFQIQNKVLKQLNNQRDLNKTNRNSVDANSMKQYRNSKSMPRHPNQYSDSNQTVSKLKPSSMKPSSTTLTSQNNMSSLNVLNQLQDQDKQNMAIQNRQQYSITQHSNSQDVSHIKRRKNKKFTDIEMFKSQKRMIQENQSFFPMIKQSNHSANNSFSKFKKNSMMAGEISKLKMSSDFKGLRNSRHYQPEPTNHRVSTHSSESDRNSRIMNYKQRVSNIQQQLAANVQHRLSSVHGSKEVIKKTSIISLKGHMATLDRLQQNAILNKSSIRLSGSSPISQLKQTPDILSQNPLSMQSLQKLIDKCPQNVVQTTGTGNIQSTGSHVAKSKANKTYKKQAREMHTQTDSQASSTAFLALIGQSTRNQTLKQVESNQLIMVLEKLFKRRRDGQIRSKNPLVLGKATNSINQSILVSNTAESPSKSSKYHSKTSSIVNLASLTKANSLDNSQIKISFFSKADFCLFGNEENSFKYEVNLKKKYHKSPISDLSPEQQQYFSSIYQIIQIIKNQCFDLYNQILAFLKFPYQTVINDFAHLNIVKDMSLESFLKYMTRIKHYHVKCGQKHQKFICTHVQQFINKIENLLVEHAYDNLFQNDVGFEKSVQTASNPLEESTVIKMI